jgi:hypothetical protein
VECHEKFKGRKMLIIFKRGNRGSNCEKAQQMSKDDVGGKSKKNKKKTNIEL